jgi:WD40 repeat protein
MVNQKAVRRFEWPGDVEGEPTAWTLTPGGAFAGILVGSPDRHGGHVVVWETESAKRLCVLPSQANHLELAPDGSLVATSDFDGRIEVWSVAAGERMTSLSSGHAAILCMAWTRDYLHRAGAGASGWLLAAGSSGGDLTIWDVQAKAARSFCRGSAYDVSRLAFSPDGMTLASVGRYHPMLWDVASGRLVLRLGGRNRMSSLAFSPDGQTLAIGSGKLFGDPDAVQVWELDQNRGQQVLRGLRAPVKQVCYRMSP